jgi:hypothetical protein
MRDATFDEGGGELGRDAGGRRSHRQVGSFRQYCRLEPEMQGMATSDTDYKRTFDEFWRELVRNPDGTLIHRSRRQPLLCR